MPRGRGIYDDENADEPKGGHPGLSDEVREGGAATREVTPDVADDKEAQEPPD